MIDDAGKRQPPIWIEVGLVLVIFACAALLFIPWDGIRNAINNGD